MDKQRAQQLGLDPRGAEQTRAWGWSWTGATGSINQSQK